MSKKKISVIITGIVFVLVIFGVTILFEENKLQGGYVAFEIWYIEYENSTDLFPIQLVNENLSKIRGDIEIKEYIKIESVHEKNALFPIPMNDYTFTENTHSLYLSGSWDGYHEQVTQMLEEISDVTQVRYVDRIKVSY